MVAQVIAFCMEHLTKCYRSVCAWPQLENWKSRETELLDQDRNSCLKKLMLEYVAPQQVTCLRKFDEGEELSLKELTDWTLLDGDDKMNWSCAKTMTECYNTLTNVALKLHTDNTDSYGIGEDIERCRKVAARTMGEGLRNVPSEYMSDAILVQYAATGLTDLLNEKSTSRNVFELSQVRISVFISPLYKPLYLLNGEC